MPAWLSSLGNQIKRLLQTLWKFFVGGVVVLVAFSGNFLDLKQPNVSVEITGIEQISSAAIDIGATPEFANLRKLVESPFAYRQNNKYTSEDMRQEIERAKQRLADSKNDLAKLRSSFQDNLQTHKLNETKEDKKKSSVFANPELPLEIMDAEDISKLPYARVREYLEAREKSLRDREALINAADDEAKSYKTKTERSDAKIVVTAAVSNAGDGATTLKPQALLRTDLGQGNYLDINLRIVNYGSGASEIKPRGTSVLSFESPSISRMSPEDQERFLNFFKNTSPTNLFIGDVRGQYYKSNTIPFAQGIYEQKIYDGLKAYASARRN